MQMQSIRASTDCCDFACLYVFEVLETEKLPEPTVLRPRHRFVRKETVCVFFVLFFVITTKSTAMSHKKIVKNLRGFSPHDSMRRRVFIYIYIFDLHFRSSWMFRHRSRRLRTGSETLKSRELSPLPFRVSKPPKCGPRRWGRLLIVYNAVRFFPLFVFIFYFILFYFYFILFYFYFLIR